jgi:hypothetical protein
MICTVIYFDSAEFQIALNRQSSYLDTEFLKNSPRRGARVVELATLERWCTRKGTVGSNPTLSAKELVQFIAALSSCTTPER